MITLAPAGIVFASGSANAALTVRQYGLNERFSLAEAVTSSTSTQQQCANMPDSVWVMVPGRSDCLR